MGHHKRIVYVVDDERVISETLAMILNCAGFIAFSFQNPQRALRSAQFATAPDLLITDVVMPEMSGIDLAIAFRHWHPQCEILLFSGQAITADLLSQAKMQGHDFEVIAKPIHPVDLLAKLQSLNGDDRQFESNDDRKGAFSPSEASSHDSQQKPYRVAS